MLLPSDVARLVLGYLQQENLTSTCQTFILESSNLKEYAEHCTDEGFIPACLLSLFGKNLTTILNEYVAMKAKETSHAVPAIMSSLWKKFDHTLSQIRSMQSSPGFAASQRARTRNGIAEIKRQKRLASHAAPSVSSELLTLPYVSGQFTTSPLTAAQVVRPVGHISTPLRSNFVVVNHAQSQETVTTGEASQTLPAAQERKAHASLMSPGRRKSESQKKTISLTGPHSTIRNFQDPNAFAVEKQMVIENAREKILSSKSLQEKLAENINKFLTGDSSVAQVPKPAECNPAEPEASIDELLGLPSEIHMSEEAIQDILEQTESDPAFQALFDLFDYGKTKNNKNIPHGISSQPMEPNPNVVLADETTLTVRSPFKTEASDDPSVQPPFCTSYQNEEASNTLKNGSNHNELTQEAQEHFSQMGSSIQKKAFKTAIPVEQKCNLDITFESMPNLNDFNQRGNSDAMCNQPCVELYTSQIATETELAMEVEKNSLSPNTPSESQLQPDQSEIPIASFVSLGADNENLVVSGKCSQLLSQNSSLPGKPANRSQLCENLNDTVGLTTAFHGSKSPDSSGIHQNKMEMNSVLPVASQQLSNCQGSAIIIASPVQPVLQGMVGMIPVSVVGQSGNAFSAAPRQVLHLPLTPSVCSRGTPQFPVPPKSQKTQGLRSKPCAGKQINNVVDSSHHSVGSRAQRNDLSEKNVVTDLGRKVDEVPVPLSGESTVPLSKPFESHRRVLCFDNTASLVGNTQQGPDPKKVPPNKEKNDISLPILDCPLVPAPLQPPSNNAIKREKPVPKILSKSETAISRHTTIRETQPEKKVLSSEIVLESFHKATANKENELCRDKEKPKNPETTKLSSGQQNGSLRNEKTGTSLQELTQKQGTPSNSKHALSVGVAVKDIKQEHTKAPSCLMSPLSKHATDTSEDSQRHGPGNKLADGAELPVPRMPGSGAGEKHKEEPTDVIKVPSSRRFVEDSAPKVMIPPVTPDLPACSPASETGSENSVSMAAHTLMILSRAAISRTTSATPLKDNTQQFRASRSATKKRKIEELDERERNSRTSNKNLGNSSIPMKKKKIKKKKLPSSFPAGMDVDKFLLSLHYDE
ncbi:protein NPAT isoform X4 [Tenrec ecaudatus]|uniref:protein NPAT isoform X4 n=1 Tax=Tenrec ecaudatus TaxID=94439 RepID=UPI003F5A7C17